MDEPADLRLRAASGDPGAQLRYALALLKGRSSDEARAEAAALIALAAQKPHADALLLHAALAVNGIGRERSLSVAYECLHRAAALNDPRAAAQLGVLGDEAQVREQWLKPINLEQLAEAPRIFAIRDFIPADACDWLMAAAKDFLEPATVLDPVNGGVIRDPLRTNSAAAISLLEPDLVTQLVCRRVAAAVGLPATCQEPTHILHYKPAEEYKPHYDFVRPWEAEAKAFTEEIDAYGQRAATLLIYLNDAFDGGETEFPRLGLRFKGRPGDALLFWNVSASGEPERDSLHAGLPVSAGEKWLFSKWVRQRFYPLH